MEERGKYGGTSLFVVSAVFVSAFLLVYPNRTVLFAPNWIIFAFSTASVTLLAGGLLLTNVPRVRERVLALPGSLKLAFSVFTMIALWHLIRHHGSYDAGDAARSFSYLILPLFAYVFYRESETALPRVLTVFWLLDVILSATECFATSPPVVAGLAMNKNWNASMLLATVPFVILLLHRKYLAKKIFYPLAALVVCVTLILTGMCRSLGAWTGLSAAGFAVLYFWWNNVRLRRKLLGWTVVVLLIGTAVGVWCFSNRLASAAGRSDRIFFYMQTPKMIADAPLTGYGIPSFEQDFLPYRTESYFMTRYAADRIDHPHNHFLFMTAGMGLIGLAAWLILLAVPVLRFGMRNMRTATLFDKICFFSCVLLFSHAQFDLILFKEPSNLLALFLLGILWRSAANEPVERRVIPLPKIPSFCSHAAGYFLCAGALLMAGLNLYASWHFRAGERLEMQGHHAESADYYRKVARTGWMDNTAYYFYQTAERHCTRELRDRDFALKLLEYFKHSATPDFAHVHLMQGRLLLTNGDGTEGLRHLIREAELYPLEPAPLLAMWEYFLRTNNGNGAKFVAEELNGRLKKLRLDAVIVEPLQHPEKGLKIQGEDGGRLADPGFDPYYKFKQ